MSRAWRCAQWRIRFEAAELLRTGVGMEVEASSEEMIPVREELYGAEWECDV